MTQPTPNKASPRYTVFMGAGAAFIIDTFIEGRDPVVVTYKYPVLAGRLNRIGTERLARIKVGRMNVTHYQSTRDNVNALHQKEYRLRAYRRNG